jgi:hypothetical protein
MATKQEILSNALEMRTQEVLEYQINIDNYRAALEKTAGDPSMQEFHSQLENLLASTTREQKKAQVMLEVVTEQLNAMG